MNQNEPISVRRFSIAIAVFRRFGSWDRHYLGEAFDEDAAYAALRKAETIGRPIGSDDWIEQMEKKSGLSFATKKRGPKPKRHNEGFGKLSP